MLAWECSHFHKFYAIAKKEHLRDMVYMQWCNMLPQMQKYMSFNEFYDTMTGENIDRRPTADIIDEIYELHPELKKNE